MNFKWSVIICCYNSTKRIGFALQKVFQQDFIQHAPIELVIVDNNSSDGLKEYVSNFTVPESISIKFVFEPEPGLSSARRAGVLACSGDYICWVDDDNDIACDYLTVASEIFNSEEKICFVGGESNWPISSKEISRPKFVTTLSKAIAIGKQRHFREGYLASGDFLWGAGLCMRRSIIFGLYKSGFKPILTGRLGEFILSGEDGELTILLQLSGGHGFYSDRLQLQHRVDNSRFTYSYFFKLFFGMGLAYPTLIRYRRLIRTNLLNQSPIKSDKILEERITSHRENEPSIRKNYFLYMLFGIFFVAGIAKGWIKGLHHPSHSNVSMALNYYKKNDYT